STEDVTAAFLELGAYLGGLVRLKRTARPTAPQEPPSTPPGDLPSGTTTPADPFSDAPASPVAPVPSEPGLTPDPEDVPSTGPAAPSDPFGSPDQHQGTDQGTEQPPYLESA
ncbi:hypothetical protein WDV06_34030, partial [Streptomyces racemochromogenes]